MHFVYNDITDAKAWLSEHQELGRSLMYSLTSLEVKHSLMLVLGFGVSTDEVSNRETDNLVFW